MNNEELIQLITKANIDVNVGGLMPPEASNQFISSAIDLSEFLKVIRVETGIVKSRALNTLGIASRLAYKAVEGVSPNDNQIKNLSVETKTLTPVEIALPYNIGFQWLRENIAQGNAEVQVNQLFATQFSNDITDLSVNGDTTQSGFLSITDGFIKLIVNDSNTHLVQRGSTTDWLKQVFPDLLAVLPAKWKLNPTLLALFVNPQVLEEYQGQLADRLTTLGDSFISQIPKTYFRGIEVIAQPYLPYGTIILTQKKNLAIGFGRDVEVYKSINARASVLEYTIKASVGFNFVIADAIAYCL